MDKKTLGRALGILAILIGLAFVVLGIVQIFGSKSGKALPSKSDAEQVFSQSQKALAVYEDTKTHARFSYPTNWIKEGTEEGGFSLKIFGGITNIRFVSDDLAARKEPGTLKAYSDLLMKQGPEEAKKKNVVIKRASDADTSLAGLPGHEWTYTLSIGDVAGRGKQVWTVKNNRSYVFTYTSSNELFDQFLPIFDTIVKTLTITQ